MGALVVWVNVIKNVVIIGESFVIKTEFFGAFGEIIASFVMIRFVFFEKETKFVETLVGLTGSKVKEGEVIAKFGVVRGEGEGLMENSFGFFEVNEVNLSEIEINAIGSFIEVIVDGVKDESLTENKLGFFGVVEAGLVVFLEEVFVERGRSSGRVVGVVGTIGTIGVGRSAEVGIRSRKKQFLGGLMVGDGELGEDVGLAGVKVRLVRRIADGGFEVFESRFNTNPVAPRETIFSASKIVVGEPKIGKFNKKAEMGESEGEESDNLRKREVLF